MIEDQSTTLDNTSFIDGDLPRPDYEEKMSLIQGEIEMVQEELMRVDDLDAEIRRVEDLRRVIMRVENPLSRHYKLTEFPDIVVALKNGIYYSSKEEAARRRQEFYLQVGMKVRVGEELQISLGIGEPLVSNLSTASASSSG